ncbi:MAG: hypothetical protein RLZZ308_533 [Candidatus Parcubacteria bacterium]|jgi:hypothetical protein
MPEKYTWQTMSMCEVTKVIPSWNTTSASLGYPTASITKDVLPSISCDLFGYSAWESVDIATNVSPYDPALTWRDALDGSLDYLRKQTKPSFAFGRNNIIISEAGIPENNPKASPSTFNAIIAYALSEKDMPWFLYWTLYDNECNIKNITVSTIENTASECDGLWIKKPDNTLGATFSRFQATYLLSNNNNTTSNAQFISQTVPTSVVKGEKFTVSITLKNSGKTTWTKGGLYRLGSQNPQDTKTWLPSGGRVFLSDTEAVKPGEQKTFTFSATAPSNEGVYHFQMRMVKEGVEWFGDSSSDVVINVTNAKASQVISPCSAVLLTKDLSYGSDDSISYQRTNGEVAKLQQFLVKEGFLLTSSYGYYGIATKNAVIAFQNKNGLSPTGTVRLNTRQAIYKARDCSTTEKSSTLALPTSSIVPPSEPIFSAQCTQDVGGKYRFFYHGIKYLMLVIIQCVSKDLVRLLTLVCEVFRRVMVLLVV